MSKAGDHQKTTSCSRRRSAMPKKILRLNQNVTQKNVSKPFMVEASRSHNALQSGRSDNGMTTYNSQKHELDNKKKYNKQTNGKQRCEETT
jgi:hypothetical protein